MPSPKPRAECGCQIKCFGGEIDYIEYCPLHEAAKELLQFIKDIRPFLGYDPEATLHKRADELITAASREDK